LAANLPPKLLTTEESRFSFQLVNSLETKLPNLRISFQNKRTVSPISLSLRVDTGLAGIEHAGDLIEGQLITALKTLRSAAIGNPLRENWPVQEWLPAESGMRDISMC
jgi:hypothetical protein